MSTSEVANGNAGVNTDLKQGQFKNLILATIFSAIGFWTWTLVGPLSKAYYAKTFDLSPSQISLLVAMPIIVGALVRIPVGALTDNYGGRIMFTVILGIASPVVLLLAVAGTSGNFGFLISMAFLLGIAGTVFAIGVPFTNLWYEQTRRGFSSGVFGAGMIGTGLSAFFTPRLYNMLGYWGLHITMAVLCAVAAALSYILLRESPLRPTGKPAPLMPKILDASKSIRTWQFSLLCAVCFGAFVAFSNYLPTFMNNVYGMDPVAAGTRTAGFALMAVIARPIAGTLCDKIEPKILCVVAFALAGVLALVISIQPEAEMVYGPLFLAMTAALGTAIGGMFAWLVNVVEPQRVGSASGIVGALGAFGGYFPPLVMGATYNAENNSYVIGLSLLAAATVVAIICCFTIPAAHKAKKAASA